MSERTLNDIVCLAITDSKFRESLLTNVADAVEEFDLDPEEKDILKTIKADSIAELAQGLHAWMVQRNRGNGYRKVSKQKQLKRMWEKRVLLLELTH